MTPAVSVVIVSQRRRIDLERAINSLRFQTLKNFEVIMVTDEPPPMNRAAELQTQIIRFREPNISRARNIGINEATAPIVAFCDDDAVPDPNWLERLIKPFYVDEKVGAAGGFVRGSNGISYQWRAVGFLPNAKDIKLDVDEGQDFTIFEKAEDYYYKCVGTNSAYRRDALHEIGGFDNGFHYYLDDTDVNKRMQDHGLKTAIVPSAQLIHNYRPSRGRNDSRVPQTLYNVGASTHLFLRKHHIAGVNEALDALVDYQSKRMRRFFHLGLVGPRQVGKLIRDLQMGINTGARRPAWHPLEPVGPLELVAPICEPVRLKIYHRPPDPPAPGEIAVEVINSPTPRPARLRFLRAGYWRLRMGRFGRLDRTGPLWRYRSNAALKEEIDRFLAPRLGSA